MERVKTAPGPDAAHAFRLGLIAAAVLGVVAMAGLYAAGEASLLLVGFLLVACFPVYLVFAAAALSVWLGYDKDATDLRPVYRERERRRG
ncbi:hypothetical protein [Halopenitus persicus]|uniref:Integral membrane protein n=1 Tax=Halopenitus persicus TaxID=1048396 RepID=A0A1H3EQ14_9EURY|nr:hypothetical protein [Halopenitus persicus]QHS17652.1 hypothetical protein GWK26_11145 [haloarchaeon 3A1-DGR]SDX80846.1 hypothetical protein SAMN05216564_101546 [Halopenitus persicus]